MRAIHNSLLSSALALALASLAAPLAAQSTTPARGTGTATKPSESAPAPAPVVRTQNSPWSTLEDQAVTIDLGASTTKPRLMKAPERGTLLVDQWPMVYVPFANVSGSDVAVVNVSDVDYRLSITIVPVNDAPSFKVGPALSNQVSGPTINTVPAWAREVSAGPGSENKSQIVWFETSQISDPDGVIAKLSIASDGTLVYELTGRPGAARYSVTAFDSGDTANGGQSVSAPKEVEFAVGVSADLAIKIVTNPTAEPTDKTRSYQLVVNNLSPATVYGARVVDLLPSGAGDTTWTCQALKGAVCPQATLGLGAIDVQVDMPGESLLVFTVEGAPVSNGVGGDGVHSAFVAPPRNVEDPYLPNNESFY